MKKQIRLGEEVGRSLGSDEQAQLHWVDEMLRVNRRIRLERVKYEQQ